MKDNKTAHLNLPLPHGENTLDVDVVRLRDSLQMLDTLIAGLSGDLTRDLAALRQALARDLIAIQGVLDTDLVDLRKSLGQVAAAAETPAGAKAKADAARAGAVEEARINTSAAVAKAIEDFRITSAGDIRLFPFRSSELPAGWYFANGDRYSLTSPQGQALNSLSGNYKNDWRIIVSSGNINLPNLFYSDGRGVFLRTVDGTTRLVGNFKDDVGRNATGAFSAIWGGLGDAPLAGVMGRTVTQVGAIAQGGARSEVTYSIDLSRQWGTHVGAEFAPVNIGMTPAVYLGV